MRFLTKEYVIYSILIAYDSGCSLVKSDRPCRFFRGGMRKKKQFICAWTKNWHPNYLIMLPLEISSGKREFEFWGVEPFDGLNYGEFIICIKFVINQCRDGVVAVDPGYSYSIFSQRF